MLTTDDEPSCVHDDEGDAAGGPGQRAPDNA